MDFEGLRQTLASREDARHQAVSVNQRHLIDKILARYSAEYTVYREVLQNGNDAGATEMQIDFDTANNSLCKAITLCNNGRPFTKDDWARLMSIAEGNPDEQKIGFFGVGFYSLFSICEEPMVVSGDKCLSFYWQRDQLFSRCIDMNGDNTDPSRHGWTMIYLSLREPIDYPNMDSFAQFMAKSLLFTASLESVQVRVNQKIMFRLDRRTSPEQPLAVNDSRTRPNGVFKMSAMELVTVQLTLDKRYSSEPESKGFFDDLWRITRESLSKDSDLYDQVRKPGSFNMFCRVFRARFNTALNKKTFSELERVTKKRPPQHVTVCCLYSSFRERLASDSSAKVKHPVLDGVLPTPWQQQTLPTGHVFIGFETHQTTGLALHCSAPFIPTVERETIDFVDSAVRLWNQELVGAVGLMTRMVWDHELSHDLTKDNYEKSADHLIRSFSFSKTAPLAVISDLLKTHFLEQGQLQVPTSVGVRPVTSIRLVPPEMQSFLLNTPQPFGSCPDFNNLLSIVNGVKQAGPEDIITELGSRQFSTKETASAIKWCLQHQSVIDESMGHALLSNLTVPCGPLGSRLSVTKAKYVKSEDSPDWTIPADCITMEMSKLLTIQEWRALSIDILPLSRLLASHMGNCEKSAVIFEDIFVCLSQRQEYLSDSELALCCSLLSDLECIPSSNNRLKRPKEVFLEDVLSFGSTSLPTVSFPRRRHIISNAILKAVGVRSHIPCQELLTYFDDKALDADRLKLLIYLSHIQDDLNGEEWDRLRSASIFPATLEGRVERRSVREVYRDSTAARAINLPVLSGVDLGDERMVRLLRKLNFMFFIPIGVIVDGLRQFKTKRMILYEYLFEHFEMYKRHELDSLDMIWCENQDALCKSSDCFTDTRVKLLKLSVVKQEISRWCEHYLNVQRRPSGSIIVRLIADNDITITDQVLELMADCEYTEADYYELSTIKLINEQTATPKQSFFRVPDHFASLFTLVSPSVYEGKPRVRQFLSAVGVREEPHANELMLACATNPEALLVSLGVKKYSSLLRLFAVHWSEMSDAAVKAFKNGHSLLGIIHELSDSKAALYDHNGVFINDDAITTRQFMVPIPPAEDLHHFYTLMGCKRVSELVAVEWMAERPEADADGNIRELISTRARIVVREGLRITDKAEEAVNLLRTVSFFKCTKINITKRWNGQSKILNGTAMYEPKGHRLVQTGNPDPFDLANAIVQIVSPFCNGSPLLSDCLLVSTLLTMPAESLLERGFMGVGQATEEIDIQLPPVVPSTTSSSTIESQPPIIEPKIPNTNNTEKPRKPKLFEKILSVLGGALTPTKDKASIEDLLKEGIRASRPNAGATVHKDAGKRPPPLVPDPVPVEGECVIPNDLVYVGRVYNYEYYARPGHPNPPPTTHQLATHLNTLSSVFSLPASTLHLFHDPTSRSIAFNRGGSLFFNCHHSHQSLSFWYVTVCHELAHNFWGPHDERHEHYMMSYAERYLERLVPYLATDYNS